MSRLPEDKRPTDRTTLLPFSVPLPPPLIFLSMIGGISLLNSVALTTYGVYAVTVAELNPFQLVFVGTALELSLFVAEVPTGVVADVYGRRVSIIIAMFLIGAGLILMGVSPTFEFILMGSILWGVGFTFESGAEEAWISDEIGEEAAAPLFFRVTQVALITRLAGIPIGVALAGFSLSLPFIVGGASFALIALFLGLTMTERGYTSVHRGVGSGWPEFIGTLGTGVKTVRGRPLLIMILVITAIYGMSSESFDRLSPLHLLDNFTFPEFAGLDEIGWFGVFRAGSIIGGIIVTEVVRRRTNLQNDRAIIGTLIVLTLVLIATSVLFGLAGAFWLAVVSFWGIWWARAAVDPLLVAWINRGLDPRTRATILSMMAQADSLGQIVGGPSMGAIATFRTVRVALVVGGVILAPTFALYRGVIRGNAMRTEIDGRD